MAGLKLFFMIGTIATSNMGAMMYALSQEKNNKFTNGFIWLLLGDIIAGAFIFSLC